MNFNKALIKSSGVVMPDGSLRKHSHFDSKKIDDRTIMLDGLIYEAEPASCSCQGCAFEYDHSETPECKVAGSLQSCLSPNIIIWKIRK